MGGMRQICIDFVASRGWLHLGQNQQSSPLTSSVVVNARRHCARVALLAWAVTGSERYMNGENDLDV